MIRAGDPSLWRRMGHGFLAALAILWFLVDELVWRQVQASFAWLHHRALMLWLERQVERLPPYGALALFALPGLITLPAKILALWASTRSPVLAVATLVLAKSISSGMAAWIYRVTRPKLLEIGWFRPLHDRLLAWHGRVLAELRELGRRFGIASRLKAWRARLRVILRHALASLGIHR